MAKAPKKLDDVFHDTLKDIYFAEKILAALPKMAKAAQDEESQGSVRKASRGDRDVVGLNTRILPRPLPLSEGIIGSGSSFGQVSRLSVR